MDGETKGAVEEGLTRDQKITVLGLSLPLTLRIFGVALVMPIFLFYGQEFTRSPLLIALSFGAYGLPQAILQIPFGILSDRIGRKKVIIIGLIIFGVGSIIAAFPQTIWGLLIGRLVQGAGAISSSVIAYIGDIVPEGKRNKAMALVGMPFGLSFCFGLVAGPLIGTTLGYNWVFIFTAIMTFATIPLIGYCLKEPRKKLRPSRITIHDIVKAARIKNLIRIDIAGFMQNFFLIANFLIIPWFVFMYVQIRGVDFYHDLDFPLLMLLVVVIGIIAMWSASGIADRGRQRIMGMIGFFLILMAGALFYYVYMFHPFVDHISLSFIIFGAISFFSGYSILEPVLKSMVIKLSPDKMRGAAAGFFNMTQFTGTFVGGAASGMIVLIGFEHLIEVIMIMSIVGIGVMASLNIDKGILAGTNP